MKRRFLVYVFLLMSLPLLRNNRLKRNIGSLADKTYFHRLRNNQEIWKKGNWTFTSFLQQKNEQVECVWFTYYMQHEVITQTRCAVNPYQDAIFKGGTEANSQPVCPSAWSLIGWPIEGNKASSFAKDVCCAS